MNDLVAPGQGTSQQGRLSVAWSRAPKDRLPTFGQRLAVKRSQFRQGERRGIEQHRVHAGQPTMRYARSPESDAAWQVTLRPSFLRSTPLMVPRTVCACQLVRGIIWLIVAPGPACSRAIRWACLLAPAGSVVAGGAVRPNRGVLRRGLALNWRTSVGMRTGVDTASAFTGFFVMRVATANHSGVPRRLSDALPASMQEVASFAGIDPVKWRSSATPSGSAMKFRRSFLTLRKLAAPLVTPVLQLRCITPEKPGADRFSPAVARFRV